MWDLESPTLPARCLQLRGRFNKKFQRESRAIGQKLSRDDNYQYIRWLTRMIFFSKTLALGVATREQHQVPHGKLVAYKSYISLR